MATLASKGLAVDPSGANFFPINSDSQSVHELRNDTATRIAVKAKCSNNAVYRLRPCFAIIEPGKRIALTIGRLSGGDPRNDKLAIHFVALADNDPPNASVFDTKKPDGQLELILMATHKPLY